MKQKEHNLVAQARAGDEKAFNSLASIFRDIALQQAARIVGNSFEAEDVVQDALYRAFAGLGELSDPQRFASWFASIVRNEAIDHLRRRFRRNEHSGDVEELIERTVSRSPPVSNQNPTQLKERIYQVTSQLTPALAEVIELRAEGLKIADIATRLHLPLGTVKRRLYDARKTIKRSNMKTFDAQTAWNAVNAAANEIENLSLDLKQA